MQLPGSPLICAVAAMLVVALPACATGTRSGVPPSPPDGTVPPPIMPPDGSVMVAMDGMVPVIPDASIPDSSVLDGSIPDASIPDASVPDAEPPDLCAGVDCTGLDGPCTSGRCVDGACVMDPSADGTSCGGMGCSTGTCMAGVCEGMVALDCTPCPGGYCALGMCEAMVDRLSVDFESGIPAGWTSTGDAAWEMSMISAHGGMSAAASPMISHRQSSGLLASFNFTVLTELSFWLRTSSEEGYDELELYVDGSLIESWSGTVAWTPYSVLLMPGARTVEWRYTKDSGVSSGADRVGIDDILITPVSVMAETMTTDFEGSAALPADLTTSGDADWSVTSGSAHGGTNAAVSGAIGHAPLFGSRTQSRLTRTVSVSGSGAVSFWYRTSTEASYDELGFYIDGALQDEWSGDTSWTQAMYTLTAGVHTLEWRYSKDGSVSSGSDQVWVDDIVTTADVTTPLPSLCSP